MYLFDVYILQNKQMKSTYSVPCTLKDALAQNYMLKMNPTFVPLSACTIWSACSASIENHRGLLLAITHSLSLLVATRAQQEKTILAEGRMIIKRRGSSSSSQNMLKYFSVIVVKRIGVEMFGVFPFDRRR